MIIYDTKNWATTLHKIYISFNKAYTTRVLFKYIFYIIVYTTTVVILDVAILNQSIRIDPLFFSLLGVILSLMLVFRLNTAYAKWWEGRQAWGSLINNSRTLVSILNSLIPKENAVLRQYFAVQISNFAITLQGHLREFVDKEELEDLESVEDYKKELMKSRNIPHKLVTMMFEKVETLTRSGLFSDFDKINIKTHLEHFIDIMGICERIKNTPIPFSHNSYIKTFILVYVLSLPFGIIGTLAYYTIPTMALVSYALIGVEVISEEVEEPFGKEANDLPLIQLSNVIKNDVFEILDCDYQLHVDSLEMNSAFIQIVH